MEQFKKENLKQFKLTYSSDYIQIESLIPFFKTQILIDKKHDTIVFQKKGKAFIFNAEPQIVYCSLVLGILKIKQSSFLVFVDNVYQQPTLPPKGYSVYQIASVDFISFKSKIYQEQEGILETLKKQIFNFGFYFSFDRDLTLRSQLFYSQSINKPMSSYFWNENLLYNLLENKNIEEWRIPAIQGYYGKFQTFIDQIKITYVLISRRSKNRSGTRFYSRGIDENGDCSNFVETEQLIILNKYLMSTVFISGSSPVFWEQKSQTKPIRLTRNKQLTKGPFVEHLINLNALYENIFLFNLLEKKKDGENLLIKAYQQMLNQNRTEIDGFCRYVYFDLNEALKKKNYGVIVEMINKVDKIIQHFNCFIYEVAELKVISRQNGIFRVSCLDCLNRTNVFMQALAIKTLEIILQHVGISMHSLVEDLLQKSDDQQDPLIKHFKNLWLSKADYESLIYAGTRAASGLKNKFLDELDSSFVSLQRLYNEKFMDRIKQTSIDLLHNGGKTKIKYQSSHRRYTSPFKISILSWNVNATSPDKLNIKQIIKHFEGSDLIAFGVQEMIELHANNIVLEEEETKFSGMWQKTITQHLNAQLQQKFIFVQKIQMVGLCLIVFINEHWKNTIRSVHKDTVKTGMGGSFGNKGGTVIRINIFDTSICLTCAHLAAGETKTKERVDDIEQIHKKAFQQNKSGIQNQSQIQASDHKFFFGDLNFRLIGEFKDFSSLFDLSKKENTPQYQQQASKLIQEFVNRDQLTQLKIRTNTSQILASYSEEKISFLPTYKLDKITGRFTIDKNRNPSWCDRILYWSDDLENHSCECSLYTALNVKGSDHRPVLGKFVVSILKQQPKLIQNSTNSSVGKEFRDTFYENDLLS